VGGYSSSNEIIWDLVGGYSSFHDLLTSKHLIFKGSVN